MVQTVSYRYKLNSSISGNLQAQWGLRQGDLLSPLWFVLVMEYLNRTLQKLAHNKKFKFHSKCRKLKIVNLSFAGDLLIFSRGDVESVSQVMEALGKFFESTGLSVNPSKCKTYFGNVEENIRRKILQATSFVEGSLPFRYMGIL